ncbi:ThiF family adenylyltransferase, partial [Elusimicrobiota bacterium]
NSRINIQTYKNQWKSIKKTLAAGKIDTLVDCVDNMQTKIDMNDFAIAHKTVLIHAGVQDMQGQITTIYPGRTGCLRCIISAESFCKDNNTGILGAAAGNIGTLQAIEAIKSIVMPDKCLLNKILFIDFINNDHKTVSYVSQKRCKCFSS